MSALDRQLAEVILTRAEFTADDVTRTGALALDAGHAPNGRQNGIGKLFASAASEGLIEWTGGVVRSMAKHRKGGAIRVWRGTDDGRVWALAMLDDD